MSATNDGYVEIEGGWGPFLKFETVGQFFEANLRRVREVASKFKPGEKEQVFDFETSGGAKFSVNAKGELKSKLPAVAIGAMVRVEFTGLRDVGKPSKMKCFKVGVKAA